MGRGADGAVGTGGAMACGAEEAGSTGVGAATLLLVCSYTDAELLAHRPKGSKGACTGRAMRSPAGRGGARPGARALAADAAADAQGAGCTRFGLTRATAR